jgi:hypothetical protein
MEESGGFAETAWWCILLEHEKMALGHSKEGWIILSSKDLQKALDHRPELNIHLTAQENAMVLDTYTDHIRELFSPFQKEYDKQVHVSRKQLEDQAKTFEEIELESCKLYDEVFCQKTKKHEDIDIFCKTKWISLKELLSGSAKTLKESSKP